MKNWKRIGYVSIEAVITASLILAVGFFALLNLSGTGSHLVQNGLTKLDGLNLFGDSNSGGTELVYDENGYPEEFNVNPGDINPVTDFTFALNLEGDGYILVSYNNKTDYDVIIPSEYEGLPVVTIGESAFDTSYTNTPLTSVILPNTIKRLDAYAFWKNQLTTVSLPNSVALIGNGAFYENMLNTLIVPNSVETIENMAFYGNQLTSIILSQGLVSIGEYAFSTNKLLSVTIPNSVTWMGEGAFTHNQLTSVNLSNGLTTIGYETFSYNQLISVVIPNSVTVVGEWAFGENQLTSITIPEGVTNIDKAAFSNNQLQSVIIPNSVTSIGDDAFAYNKLNSIIIPENVTYMGNSAFYDNQLNSVTFLGALPETLGWAIFQDNFDLGIGSVRVPAASLTDYQAVAESEFGLIPENFIGY